MSLLELNPVKEPVVFSGLVTRLLAFYGVNTTKKPEKQEVVKHIILSFYVGARSECLWWPLCKKLRCLCFVYFRHSTE